jgi:4-diphosphocytidyl-2-C-methyl-D-erythritol kinase
MTDARARRVRVHAPAKINLTLQVLGIRPDGYHDVRTTLQSLALHDTLTCSAVRGGFAIDCDDPQCPRDQSNLVWRAADALWRAAGRRGAPSGARVHIRKRIPMQAGLGGGSSDAAAALRALSALWRVRMSDVRLHDLARTLGADVPFFFEGGTVLGVDRGDVLFPLIDQPRSWVVLVLPNFGVSTPDAYRWWDEGGGKTSSSHAGNDLERPVAARHPEIGRIATRLKRLGAASAAMSGSGAAVFGLFDREGKARTSARELMHDRRTVLITRTINRRQYANAVRLR